jgi:DNA-binding transcriptional ArsR family regulator
MVSNNLPFVDTYQQHQLDALGDPTRRAILAQLVDGPKAVVDLAREFPVSRPAISQHLRVLKQANLVKDRPEGNRRLYQLNPEGFATVREYLEQFWGQALHAFRRKVEEQQVLSAIEIAHQQRNKNQEEQ